jgi:hypothetical protein
MVEKKFVTLMLHQNFVVFYILFIKFDKGNIMTINVMSYYVYARFTLEQFQPLCERTTPATIIYVHHCTDKDYFKPFSLD